MTQGLRIRRLEADEPAFETVARWRHDAFFEEDGVAYADSRAQLHDLAANQGYEIALLAEVDDAPAGLCLFIRHEIEPQHDLTPWLAALFVAPQFRKRGVASALVRAIEAHARSVGSRELHLHTFTAEAFYATLGWQVRDRTESNGDVCVLMAREL